MKEGPDGKVVMPRMKTEIPDSEQKILDKLGPMEDDKMPKATELPPDVDKQVELNDTEMEKLRFRNQQLMEELRLMKKLKGFPTSKPIISKPLPANYCVWLGPEPVEDTQLSLPVKGTVKCIPCSDKFPMVDGDGKGKERMISGTTHSGVTSEWMDHGYSSVDFEHRCPPNHKYSGRLYGEILCPEHAAYLQLTAGRDKKGTQMFAWYLTDQFRVRYEVSKQARLRRNQIENQEIQEIQERGQIVPLED